MLSLTHMSQKAGRIPRDSELYRKRVAIMAHARAVRAAMAANNPVIQDVPPPETTGTGVTQRQDPRAIGRRWLIVQLARRIREQEGCTAGLAAVARELAALLPPDDLPPPPPPPTKTNNSLRTHPARPLAELDEPPRELDPVLDAPDPTIAAMHARDAALRE